MTPILSIKVCLRRKNKQMANDLPDLEPRIPRAIFTRSGGESVSFPE